MLQSLGQHTSRQQLQLLLFKCAVTSTEAHTGVLQLLLTAYTTGHVQALPR
jgi:hypothetical protein